MVARVTDLGNACWTNRHFTDDIQTRQYRSLEVMLGTWSLSLPPSLFALNCLPSTNPYTQGAEYEANTDCWSAACTVFELLTGDFLFEPRSTSWCSRDEDHLLLFQETLGPIPKSVATSGRYFAEMFNRKGEMKNKSCARRSIKPFPIADILQQKYKFGKEEAEGCAAFLEPMLIYQVSRRVSAKTAMEHPWLSEALALHRGIVAASSASADKGPPVKKPRPPPASSSVVEPLD
jgi:serine/threonine protein kinase